MSDRLQIWGCRLFRAGDLHLDLLLGASKAWNDKLAEPLAAHFVEIALEQRKFGFHQAVVLPSMHLLTVLVRVMDSILASEPGRNTSALKTASSQLKTVLLSPDITQPMLEDLFYVSLMEQSQDNLPQETVKTHVKYLSNMVELLFAYLPGINRLRLSR